MNETGPIRGVSVPDKVPGAQPVGARTREILLVSVSILALAAWVWLLSWAKGLLIPLSFAVFLSVCLRPAVGWLARLRIPPAVGAAVVLVALSAVVGVAIDRTRDDAAQVLDQMPAAARYLRREVNAALNNPGSLAHRIQILVDLPTSSVGAGAARPALPAPAPQEAPMGFAAGTMQFFAVASEAAAVLFLVYLMLASRGRLAQRIAQGAGIPASVRRNARRAFRQIEHALHHYLAMLVLTNVLLGLVVWGVFELLGVHYALAWGVASAITHFVPYVGPALIAGGSAVFASVQFDSLARGLVIGGTTLALSSVIGVGLQTWLFGRSVRMNTVGVFVSLIFWSWIWGLPGLVLGTPLTMAFKVVCGHIPWLAWVDTLLDTRHGERFTALPEETAPPATRHTTLPGVERVLPS